MRLFDEEQRAELEVIREAINGVGNSIFFERISDVFNMVEQLDEFFIYLNSYINELKRIEDNDNAVICDEIMKRLELVQTDLKHITAMINLGENPETYEDDVYSIIQPDLEKQVNDLIDDMVSFDDLLY